MVNSLNTDLIKNTAQNSEFEKISQSKFSSKDDEKLKKAAQDFEAVFISQMFNIMDSTVEKSDFLGNGKAEQTFKSMMYQNVAQDVSSNPSTSFGLAKQIYEQMKNSM